MSNDRIDSPSTAAVTALTESDFTSHEWAKISTLCSEYVRLQSVKSDIESDMSELKESVEAVIRSTLEITPTTPLPLISSSNWLAKPQSRTTQRINANKLIEHGIEKEVIDECTDTTITHFLQIEDPNKRKGKGKGRKKGQQDVSEELISIFGSGD